MQEPNIVVVGHVCIDHNTSEQATYTGWGSSVLYISQYYRKYSRAKVTAVSNYGPDMLEFLPPITLLPATPPQPRTLRYQNDTRSKVRIWSCSNVEVAGPPAITPEIAEAVRAADIVIVATLLPNYPAEYLQQLLSCARPESLKMLCPQGYFRHIGADGMVSPREFEEAPAILPSFDLVVYSIEDHPGAMELAQAWKQTASANIVVTQNKDGATIVEADRRVHIPTTPIPPEEIIDSVGCGDTFEAALALEYYQTKDLAAAVGVAHKAAAAKLKAVITV